MTEFEDEIRALAREKASQRRGETSSPTQQQSEIKEVMSELQSLAELGVNTYNKTSGNSELSIYGLSEEIMTLFLNLPGKRSGFCITAAEKFVIFLAHEPDEIVVLGKKKQVLQTGEGALTKARQLLRVSYVMTENKLQFKDNTGTLLSPEEVAVHIIRWLVSV